MTRLLALAALGLVSTAALFACGGAAESAPPRSVEAPAERAPAPPPPPPEPTSVEEAQRQIAYAATEINTQTLNVAKPEGKPASSADADTSRPHPKQEPSGNGGASKASEYQHDELVNRCASPCRALASMQRAVDALCRMTGETDAKCVDARKTLADNVGRTATCKCGS